MKILHGSLEYSRTSVRSDKIGNLQIQNILMKILIIRQKLLLKILTRHQNFSWSCNYNKHFLRTLKFLIFISVEFTDFSFQTWFGIIIRYSSYNWETPTMFPDKILVKIDDLCENQENCQLLSPSFKNQKWRSKILSSILTFLECFRSEFTFIEEKNLWNLCFWLTFYLHPTFPPAQGRGRLSLWKVS